MTIRFHCNECQSRVKVPDGTEGKKVKCPRCGNVQRVPEDDGLPSPGKSARKAKADAQAQDQAQPQTEPETPTTPTEPETVGEAMDDESDSGDPLAALAAAAGDEDEGDDEDEAAPSPWSEPDAEQTQPEPDEAESEPETPDDADADDDTDEPEQADAQPGLAGDQRSPQHDQPASTEHKPKPEPKPEPEPKSAPPEKAESLGTPKLTRPKPNPQPMASPKAIPLSSRAQSSYHPPAQVNPQSEQVGGDDARSREAVAAQSPPQELASGKPVQPPGYPALRAISWALRILAVLTVAMGAGMSVPLFRGESVMLGLLAVIVGLILAVVQLALGEAVSALRDIARNSFHLRR